MFVVTSEIILLWSQYNDLRTYYVEYILYIEYVHTAYDNLVILYNDRVF